MFANIRPVSYTLSSRRYGDESGKKDDGVETGVKQTAKGPEPVIKGEKIGECPIDQLLIWISSLSVVPKPNKDRPKLDVTQASTERNFITPIRAMNEYLLKPDTLSDLRKFQRRSPYEDAPPITVYLRRDVEARSLQVWGTWDSFQKEFNKRKLLEESYRDSVLNVKKVLREYKRINDPEAKLRAGKKPIIRFRK